ncbi:Ku protein [Stackebrandtia soli]|uniref:non-homologous end joining protein Ku n=1 Tax=Stackebrandtia soli TaxID=1892856 RepID=UPI0039EA1CE4
MRSIWKGAVSFGLISIAVKAYAATETKDIRFHQVHRRDGGRIRYRKFCELENSEVDFGEIVRAVELPDKDMVILEDSDFDQLPLATKNVIDVIEFVPEEDIDPLMYAKSYYLEPADVATKPYALLRKTLSSTEKVAVAKVALRQKEQLATLRDHDGVLVLQTMLWPDEVRAPELKIPDDAGVRDQEVTMATTLVDSMSSDHFDAAKYHDDYRQALQKVIDAKVAGDEVLQPPESAEEGGAKVIDLMDALQRSVDKAKKDSPKKAAKKTTRRKKAA